MKEDKLSIKEQRKILMQSILTPGPKPYIQAAYEQSARKPRRKMTDAEKGAHEAYLFSLSKQGDA